MWRTRAALQLEILALHHQIGVLQQALGRFCVADRLSTASGSEAA
jgi:hypothetical protein